MTRVLMLLAILILFMLGCNGETPISPTETDDDTVVDVTNTNTQTVTIIVHQHPPNTPDEDDPANRPPTIVQPQPQSDIADRSVSLQIVGTDPDGDSLTWTATGLPRGLNINRTTGIITGTISSSSAVDSPFNCAVTVTDGSLIDTASFIWTVLPVVPVRE